jgi:succinyl-CoA synthetase alpha subunit
MGVAEMAILVDNETRLVVQGITGRQGRFHTERMLASDTQVVAGVTPGKRGEEYEGVPVFNTVDEAVEETGANASIIFVPPPLAADAIFEALDSELSTVCCITEGVPVHDMMRVANYLRVKEATLIGPNCPGVLSPGKSNVSIMPADIFTPGSVGVVSRSGTLTYQIVDELTQNDLGQSTAVGIGGDPIIGTDFIEILSQFEADPETECAVMIGEIGGNAEQLAAEYVQNEMTIPVVAYIAGFTAPEGKTMGHAGAIVSGGESTAQAKSEALERAGIRAAKNPSEVADLVAEALDGSG